MSMEQTNAVWLFCLTKKKNVLAKVSSLNQFGKIRIEDLKLIYGRKKSGHWMFQLKGEPSSRVFSFHDGEVILNQGERFESFRPFGARLYGALLAILWLGVFSPTMTSFWKDQPKKEPSEKAQAINKVAPKKNPNIAFKKRSLMISDPEARNSLTNAKRMFQMGEFSKMMKILKPNLEKLSLEDREAAHHLISQMYFVHCRNFFHQHEERKAVVNCEKSLKYEPNEKARMFLDQQDQAGRKMYLEGYTMLTSNPQAARQKFKQVLQVAKTQSTWRNKAEYQLRKKKN